MGYFKFMFINVENLIYPIKSYIFFTPIFHWGPQEINEFIGYIKFSTLININLKYGFYLNISIILNSIYMDVQLYSKHKKTSPPYGELVFLCFEYNCTSIYVELRIIDIPC